MEINMEGLDWLMTGIGYLTAAAALITTLSVAGSWLWKGFKNLKKPHLELTSHVEDLKKDLQEHIQDSDSKINQHGECLARDQEGLNEVRRDIQEIFSVLLKLAHNDKTDEDFYRICCEIEEHLVHKSLGYDRKKNEY